MASGDAGPGVRPCHCLCIEEYREIAGRKALLQAGVAVPIFVVTKKVKDLIIEKIRQGGEPVLFRTTKLPVLTEQQPEPLA